MARWPPWTTMATSHVTIYLTSRTNLDDGAWGARCGRKLARLLARERTTVSPTMTTTDGKCPLAFPPLPPPRVHYRTMGISRKGGGNRVDGRAFNPLSSCLAVRKCSHQRENRRDTGKRGRRKKQKRGVFLFYAFRRRPFDSIERWLAFRLIRSGQRDWLLLQGVPSSQFTSPWPGAHVRERPNKSAQEEMNLQVVRRRQDNRQTRMRKNGRIKVRCSLPLWFRLLSQKRKLFSDELSDRCLRLWRLPFKFFFFFLCRHQVHSACCKRSISFPKLLQHKKKEIKKKETHVDLTAKIPFPGSWL